MRLAPVVHAVRVEQLRAWLRSVWEGRYGVGDLFEFRMILGAPKLLRPEDAWTPQAEPQLAPHGVRTERGRFLAGACAQGTVFACNSGDNRGLPCPDPGVGAS